MCTRDWQRHSDLSIVPEAPLVWPGLSHVATLEADGTVGRRFVDCSDGRCRARRAALDERVTHRATGIDSRIGMPRPRFGAAVIFATGQPST